MVLLILGTLVIGINEFPAAISTKISFVDFINSLVRTDLFFLLQLYLPPSLSLSISFSLRPIRRYQFNCFAE